MAVGNYFAGVLLVTFLFRAIFYWLTKKLRRPLLQICLANALSLAAYTVAMRYSLVTDLTSNETPHFLKAFSMAVLPQLIWLAYDFWHYRDSQKLPFGG
jgi:hypothetical protein